jgi:hypothetical protein
VREERRVKKRREIKQTETRRSEIKRDPERANGDTENTPITHDFWNAT